MKEKKIEWVFFEDQWNIGKDEKEKDVPDGGGGAVHPRGDSPTSKT